MGIISGFLKGGGMAAAQAGTMLLRDKLLKERDEANFLRDSTLRRDMQDTRLDHLSTENETRASATLLAAETKVGTDASAAETRVEADQEAAKALGETRAETANKLAETEAEAAKKAEEAAMERTKYVADAKAGKTTPTTQMKNVEYLMSPAGGGNTIQQAIVLTFPEATIKHTDPDGNIVVVERTSDGAKQIATIRMNDRGVPEFVAEGDEISRTRATKAERQDEADRINKEEDNNWPWTRVGPNDPAVKKSSGEKLQTQSGGSERISNEEFNDNGGTGIVSSEIAGPTKKIEGGSYTFEQFTKQMKRLHGDKADTKSIQETWDSFK